MLLITTNQAISFTDICDVHGELSNMYKLLHHLTVSPSAFSVTTGLSAMPGTNVTVPLQ